VFLCLSGSVRQQDKFEFHFEKLKPVETTGFFPKRKLALHQLR